MKFSLDILDIFLSIGILIFIAMMLTAYTFRKENESRPVMISLIAGILILSLTIVFSILIQIQIFAFLCIGILFIALLIFIIPVKYKAFDYKEDIDFQLDERDIMFSRDELVPDSDNFNTYYKMHPNKKITDDKFRNKPGLLSEKSQKYHPLKFASADANFESVKAFKYLRDTGNENLKEKQSIDPKELSEYIKKWFKQIGAISVGITALKDHHIYKIKGRGKDYGKKFNLKHPTAIVFTVEMDKNMIDHAPDAETVTESSQQYFRSAAFAAQLTLFIRNLGYSAKPHFDGNYDLLCTTVARDAGLGELGRMGLLMSHEIGPRVRIAVVSTDIPLVYDKRKQSPSMIEFCKICKKCADNCPTNAIFFDNIKEDRGTKRWTINHEACFTYWNVIGTDCAKCIQVCPYSHPDNFMHNLIRKGINNSKLFAKAALKADDLFYGRIPNTN